jgi:hypothetical protein
MMHSSLLQAAVVFVLMAFAPCSDALRRSIPMNTNRFRNNMQRELVPQLFVAGCAGALVFYVATNIESIKAQQKVAIEKVMTEQATNVRSAQETQRAAIEAAQAQQAAATARAKQVAQDAQRSADRNAGR